MVFHLREGPLSIKILSCEWPLLVPWSMLCACCTSRMSMICKCMTMRSGKFSKWKICTTRCRASSNSTRRCSAICGRLGEMLTSRLGAIWHVAETMIFFSYQQYKGYFFKAPAIIRLSVDANRFVYCLVVFGRLLFRAQTSLECC